MQVHHRATESLYLSELVAKLESTEQRLAAAIAAQAAGHVSSPQTDAFLGAPVTDAGQALAAAEAGEEAELLRAELAALQLRLSGLEARAGRVAELEAELYSIREARTSHAYIRRRATYAMRDCICV